MSNSQSKVAKAAVTRVTLGGGRWFDPGVATRYKEDTRWDGNNNISVATGSQFDHEWMYKTRLGVFILHSWSQWSGSTDTYKIVDRDTAHRWLIKNREFDAVPASVLDGGEV